MDYNNLNIDELFNDFERQVKVMIETKKRKSEKPLIPETINKKAKKALQEIEDNFDFQWSISNYLELKRRNWLDKTALYYRGSKITYKEMYATSFYFAKLFNEMGVSQYDQIPLMISNSPEFVYSIIGLNLLGASANIMGSWFSPDYIEEITNYTGAKFILLSDDNFEPTKKAIENCKGLKNVVLFSLTDSLPLDENGNRFNPFAEIDSKFGHFENLVDRCRSISKKNIIDLYDFLGQQTRSDKQIIADGTLDDLAYVTYTSGTTRPGYPKGCKHSNRNYSSLSRFKKADVSGNPTMKKFRGMAHLPSYTQTGLSAIYTDSIYMGWEVALEPYYDLDFYPYSIIINEPNLTVETPEYEKYLAKKLETEWQNVKMPYRVAITVAGQALSPGLEKYLNTVSKKHKFGTAKLPWPISPVKMSIAGGTTENGGMLVTLFKGLRELSPKHKIHREGLNLMPLQMSEVEVLRPDGTKCELYERGICYVNSPSNQIGYVNDEFNKDMYLQDSEGKTWYSSGTPSYKDRFGGIRMVDRPKTDIITEDGEHTAIYTITDPIQLDTDNIMEAYVVKVEVDGEEKYVCHIEMQPNSKVSFEEVVAGCRIRLAGKVREDILSRLYFRYRSFEEGFPVNGTGKTDLLQVKEEGLSSDCIPYVKNKRKCLK